MRATDKIGRVRCSVDLLRGHEWRFVGDGRDGRGYRMRCCRKCGLPYRYYGYLAADLFRAGPARWPCFVPPEIAEKIMGCLP